MSNVALATRSVEIAPKPAPRKWLVSVGTILATALGGWISQQLTTLLTSTVGGSWALPVACLFGALMTWLGERAARTLARG